MSVPPPPPAFVPPPPPPAVVPPPPSAAGPVSDAVVSPAAPATVTAVKSGGVALDMSNLFGPATGKPKSIPPWERRSKATSATSSPAPPAPLQGKRPAAGSTGNSPVVPSLVAKAKPASPLGASGGDSPPVVQLQSTSLSVAPLPTAPKAAPRPGTSLPSLQSGTDVHSPLGVSSAAQTLRPLSLAVPVALSTAQLSSVASHHAIGISGVPPPSTVSVPSLPPPPPPLPASVTAPNPAPPLPPAAPAAAPPVSAPSLSVPSAPPPAGAALAPAASTAPAAFTAVPVSVPAAPTTAAAATTTAPTTTGAPPPPPAPATEAVAPTAATAPAAPATVVTIPPTTEVVVAPRYLFTCNGQPQHLVVPPKATLPLSAKPLGSRKPTGKSTAERSSTTATAAHWRNRYDFQPSPSAHLHHTQPLAVYARSSSTTRRVGYESAAANDWRGVYWKEVDVHRYTARRYFGLPPPTEM